MLVKQKGIIEFDPVNVTKKHKSQSSWKCVAIIKTNCDMDQYYAWFLRKRFGIKLNRNLRGSHITFISDKMDRNVFEEGAKIFNGKEIEFYIELEPRGNGNHWWLRTYSPDTESIRQCLGLSKDPYYGLHFTLGLANEFNLDQSKYIVDVCKFHELTTNSSRIPLEDHKIIVDFT
jgi:hypothetical protein